MLDGAMLGAARGRVEVRKILLLYHTKTDSLVKMIEKLFSEKHESCSLHHHHHHRPTRQTLTIFHCSGNT